MTVAFPFTAIVAQEDLKRALLLNAVDPAIGGVLVRGHKGTAKSTAVRALASLLPPVEAIVDCPFGCDPAAPFPECPAGPHADDAPAEVRPTRLVELPIGATEDRVAGSIDLEAALTGGTRAFEPGLLAAAHRGILYVDEVNLLNDHLVDLLLDAAAMGVAHVEREGVSVRHAARFLLVGTMNPEEGELRPQLLDRFGLAVEVTAPTDAAARAEVVRRRLAYEKDPPGFAERFAADEAELAKQVVAARELLPLVGLPEPELERIVEVCAAFGVDGLRADIVMAKAARAVAAWDGRDEVARDDVRDAAKLVLPHRRRRQPFEDPGLDEDELERALDRDGDDDPPSPPSPGGGAPPDADDPGGSGPDVDAGGPEAAPDDGVRGEPTGDEEPMSSASERRHGTGATFTPALLTAAGAGAGALGRRSAARGEHGSPVGARPWRDGDRDLAVAATVRAAAPHQAARGRRPGDRLVVHDRDLQATVRQGREGNLVVFVVDASGSMGARRRMVAVKGAVRSLLLDAYQRRDRIALISFRGHGADLLLPPTSSVEVAERRLHDLPTGGRTPLAAGLRRAAEVVAVEAVRDPSRRPLVVVLTDGRANAGPDPVGAARRAAAGLVARDVAGVVVDTEEGFVRLGLAGELAAAMGAPRLCLEDLAATSLARTVRATTRRTRHVA